MAAVGAAPGAEDGGSSAVSLASSAACDFSSCPFVRLLIAEYQRAQDHVVRDGIAKALALPGDVNEHEALVSENVDLGSSAIVDAYFNILGLAASNCFSALQTQQLLLLLSSTLDLLATHAPSPAVADVPLPSASGAQTSTPPPITNPLNDVLYYFTRKLARLCSAAETLVDERKVVTTHRTEERVDPAALAAYEAKLAKAKKGAVVEPPPKEVVTITEETEVFERKTITIGPFFNRHDAALIVEYFNATVFQHWVLYQHVLRGNQREVITQRREVFIDDVPVFLPPLAAAVTLDDYTLAEERRAVENAAIGAVKELRADEEAEWTALARSEAAEGAELRRREDEERAADKARGMTAAEYDRTSRVIGNAVAAAVHKKTTAAALMKRLERIEAAAAAGGAPSPASPTTAAGSPAGAGSPAASPKAAASRKGQA